MSPNFTATHVIIPGRVSGIAPFFILLHFSENLLRLRRPDNKLSGPPPFCFLTSAFSLMPSAFRHRYGYSGRRTLGHSPQFGGLFAKDITLPRDRGRSRRVLDPLLLRAQLRPPIFCADLQALPGFGGGRVFPCAFFVGGIFGV